MRQAFFTLEIKTKGQNLYEFTDHTIKWINTLKLENGILNLSILHTSASLILQENADPDVKKDLLNYFDKLVPMNSCLLYTSPSPRDRG